MKTTHKKEKTKTKKKERTKMKKKQRKKTKNTSTEKKNRVIPASSRVHKAATCLGAVKVYSYCSSGIASRR